MSKKKKHKKSDKNENTLTKLILATTIIDFLSHLIDLVLTIMTME